MFPDFFDSRAGRRGCCCFTECSRVPVNARLSSSGLFGVARSFSKGFNVPSKGICERSQTRKHSRCLNRRELHKRPRKTGSENWIHHADSLAMHNRIRD